MTGAILLLFIFGMLAWMILSVGTKEELRDLFKRDKKK